MDPIQSDGVLSSEARRRVYDLVLAEPGISVSELARRADMYWTSAALHAAALERAGLVQSVLVGRRRSIFPVENRSALGTPAAALLSEPACRRVAEGIVRYPDLRVWELCDILQMSERAVYHHVKRLVNAGLVSSTRPGMYRGLRALPALERLLPTDDRE